MMRRRPWESHPAVFFFCYEHPPVSQNFGPCCGFAEKVGKTPDKQDWNGIWGDFGQDLRRRAFPKNRRRNPADFTCRNKSRSCKAPSARSTADGNADHIELFQDFIHRGCKRTK